MPGAPSQGHIILAFPSSERGRTGAKIEPWLCRSCGLRNRARAGFCGRCGLPLEVRCPACGEENPGGHRYCDICGGTLDETSSGAPVGGQAAGVSLEGLFPRILRQDLAGYFRKGLDKGLVWYTPSPNWRWTWSFLREWTLRNWWELLAVLLLTIAGAFLRVYRLEALPSGFHGDEAWTGIEGLRILEEGWVGPYTSSALGQLTGPFYLTALTIRLLDASVFAVRLSIGLFGIATIPASHLLLRLGFGRWVALFGTTALTVSYWHLHFSRLGFGVAPLAFASTVAAAGLLWAMRSFDAGSHQERRGNLWSWVIAGGLLGLVPYTYFAFPTFLGAVGAVIAIFFLLQGDPLRRKVQPLLPLVAGALITAGQVLLFAFRSPDVYFGRMNDKTVFAFHEYLNAEGMAEKAGFLARHFWESYTLLMRNPRLDGVDGIGGVGALDPGMALLAYAGLIVSVRRWRSPPHLLAALVVVAALSGLVFTDPSAGSMRRSITAIPWVFGLAGVAAAAIAQFAKRHAGRWGQAAAVSALLLVLMGSGLWNLNYYFSELPNSPTFKWTFADDYLEALEAAHSFEEPGTIYYYSGRRKFGYETIQFLYPESRGVDRSREFGVFDLERLDRGPVTYILEGSYMEEVGRIMELYPGGELIVDGGEKPVYAIYHVTE